MNKPIAVLISDIHYNINSLQIANLATEQAVLKSNELLVPLIVAGDLHDTKGHLRGECVKAIIDVLKKCIIKPIVLVGNHDRINERSEEHSLEFLKPIATIVDGLFAMFDFRLNLGLIPYFSDSQFLLETLKQVPKGSTIIMHQGVQSAKMGHYIQDKTSLPKEAFKDYRVISGHYHQHQTIKCRTFPKGNVGLFTYIGSPYTVSFSEAFDGPKGFQLLYADGSLEQVQTNLRKHIISERKVKDLLDPVKDYVKGDLVWLKVSGPKSELDKIKKEEVGKKLFGHNNFKLDKVYTDAPKLVTKSDKLKDFEIFDKLIDATDEAEDQKSYLKKLWRGLVNETTSS